MLLCNGGLVCTGVCTIHCHPSFSQISILNMDSSTSIQVNVTFIQGKNGWNAQTVLLGRMIPSSDQQMKSLITKVHGHAFQLSVNGIKQEDGSPLSPLLVSALHHELNEMLHTDGFTCISTRTISS
jgi:hypothetical protein